MSSNLARHDILTHSSKLGFKVDNGQENNTVLKWKETMRQSITTTITKRKNRHSRATQKHPDMKGENTILTTKGLENLELAK